jgi:hypothetical protein
MVTTDLVDTQSDSFIFLGVFALDREDRYPVNEENHILPSKRDGVKPD